LRSQAALWLSIKGKTAANAQAFLGRMANSARPVVANNTTSTLNTVVHQGFSLRTLRKVKAELDDESVQVAVF
jgi:hypothetical protein